jgi:hypothetical protein
VGLEKTQHKFKILVIGIQVFLHGIFLFGLGRCTALAPDEVTYSNLFEKSQNSKLPGFTNSVIGSNNYIFEANFQLASLFTKLNFSNLDALRINSIIFFTISQILNLYLIDWNTKNLDNRYRISLYFLNFMTPSIFIFSGLALRESLILLSLSLIFFGLQKVEESKIIVGQILLFLGLLVISGLKIYLFLLIVLVFFMYFLLNKFNSRRIILFFLLSFSICSTINFNNIVSVFKSTSIISTSETTPRSLPKNESNMRFELSSPDPKSVTLTELELCRATDSLGFLRYVLHFINPETAGTETVGTETVGTETVGTETVGTETAGTETAGTETAGTETAGTETAGDIYGGADVRGFLHPKYYLVNLLYFLFNPLLSLELSTARWFLIEAPIWIFLTLSFIVYFARSPRRVFRLTGVPSFMLYFSLLFVAYSTATEVNVGTSLRHRVLLLFPLSLLVAHLSTISERKSPRE